MEVIDMIAGYGAWAWVVAGVILLALELLAPGGFFLWLGVSGIVTGLVSLLQPIDWPWQWLIFGALSLVTILAWMRFAKGRERPSDRPFLNRRAHRFVGQEAVLDEPIRDGFGRVALDDTVWRIAGPDLAAGTKVRIIGAEGAVLRVEAV